MAMHMQTRRPQRLGKIAFYSSVALVVAGMAVSEVSSGWALNAKSKVRNSFYAQAPIADSNARRRASTFELAAETPLLSAQKIGRLDSEMMLIAERKVAKPYKKAEAAGQWIMVFGVIAMLASFVGIKIKDARGR